jgi:hypothetical protein
MPHLAHEFRLFCGLRRASRAQSREPLELGSNSVKGQHSLFFLVVVFEGGPSRRGANVSEEIGLYIIYVQEARQG